MWINSRFSCRIVNSLIAESKRASMNHSFAILDSTEIPEFAHLLPHIHRKSGFVWQNITFCVFSHHPSRAILATTIMNRIDCQMEWYRTLKMASTVYETEICSAEHAYSNSLRACADKMHMCLTVANDTYYC